MSERQRASEGERVDLLCCVHLIMENVVRLCVHACERNTYRDDVNLCVSFDQGPSPRLRFFRRVIS
jgi:hypothetical protein